ncbi:MAG: type II secretion system protein [Planctomycetota bacterium]|jgi:prepilin-type N-terminal cleavage/methylation domain-containing protein/prepilin-type processing-associated H-X9-DG protein
MCRERRSEGERGFTLIELLVVVSIVTLLMALLFPVLHKARKQARAVACQANLHQWAMILQQYTNEHEGRFFRPVKWDLDSWFRVLRADYAEYEALWACPALKKWKESRRDARPTGYGLNGWVNDASGANRTDVPNEGRTYLWRRVDAARHPGNVPVFMDHWTAGRFDCPIERDEPPPYHSDYVNEIGNVASPIESPMAGFCTPRHGSFVNVVFMDWSVRRVGLKQLWTLRWHREYDTNGPWTKAGGVQPEDWPKWMRQCKDY